MKPYGRRRNMVGYGIKGHGDWCTVCHPIDVNKKRARREAKDEIRKHSDETREDS